MDHEAAIAKIRAQGGTDADVEAYLRSVGAQEIGPEHPDHPDHVQRVAMAKRRADSAVDKAEAQVSDHPLLSSLAETASTPLAGVPGGALLMSGLRSGNQGAGKTIANLLLPGSGSLVDRLSGARGPTMAETQQDVNRETSDVPYASALGRGIGAIAASTLLPKGGIAGGATLGGAEGLLNNENAVDDLGGRLAKAAGGAVVGGAAGGLLSGAITAARTYAPPWLKGTASLGRNILDRRTARTAATKPLYAAGEAEGNAAFDPNAGGVRNISALRRVIGILDNPEVKPFAEKVKEGLEFRKPFYNAAGQFVESPNPATQLREAYKLMGERQRALGSKIADASSFPTGTSIEKGNLDILKQTMADVGGDIMPSWRQGNEVFAEHSGGIENVKDAAKAARRIISGAKPNINKLETQAPEAFLDRLGKMTPGAARNATEGIIGAAKDEPFRKMLLRTPKLLRAADARSGQQLPSALQRAILALAGATGGDEP